MLNWSIGRLGVIQFEQFRQLVADLTRESEKAFGEPCALQIQTFRVPQRHMHGRYEDDLKEFVHQWNLEQRLLLTTSLNDVRLADWDAARRVCATLCPAHEPNAANPARYIHAEFKGDKPRQVRLSAQGSAERYDGWHKIHI